MKKLIIIFVTLIALLGAQSIYAETKRALLIGISDYGNEKEDPEKWSNINGANDIELLTPLFKNQGFKVTTLTDKQATHDGIIKSIKDLAKNCKKGDIVYLHFSMHGQPFEDLNGDEEDGWDEALIPVDAEMKYVEGVYEGTNHLLDDELEVYFDNIRSKLGPSGKLYVILDACHSGEASRGGSEPIRGTKDGFTRSGKEYKPNKSQVTNDYFLVKTKEGQSPVTFLEACRSYQVNKEIRDKETDIWYGSLSYYIAKAMNDHKIADNEDWIETVKQGMSSNKKLRFQNLVIEKSE